jgi:hypothetical protein
MNRALLIVLIGVVMATLIAGFSIVGGPGYARMETHDHQRAQELVAWGAYYRCEIGQETVAPEITTLRNCDNPRAKPLKKDPVSGEPYEFKQQDANTFEVCATFETEGQTLREYQSERLHFDGRSGCVRYVRTDAQSVWQLQ